MHTYQVNVTREDGWWMVDVPELDRHVGVDGAVNVSTLTQARRLGEVDAVARDFICTVTDKAPSQVRMHLTITVDDIDVNEQAAKIVIDRELADRHSAAAQVQARSLARQLAAHGVAVRDVGEVLGVSFQRAQQLISS